MRILLITPYYFPNINPRAHRWTSIAEEWAKDGHEIHIICSKRNNLPNTSQLNKVTVHRTGYNSLKEVFYNLFRIKKRRGEPQSNKPKALKRSRLMTFLVWFNEAFWKKIYFPDDACVWYFPARKKAIQLLNANQFDALISVSLPFTAQLIGLYCKKYFPEIPWITDIGDPFSLQFNHQLNNHFLYRKLNIRWERKVLERADTISVTTEGTKKLYEEYFEGLEGKIVVIPPLLKLNYEEEIQMDLSLDSSKIHIGYFGSFFPNVREPDGFLNLLNKALEADSSLKEKIMIHFFGDISEDFLKTFERYSSLNKNIILHGLIPRGVIQHVMSQMDFLLNISNKSEFQLPSKSVDYMASGKPIINIHSIDNDLFKIFFMNHLNILNIKIELLKVSEKAIKDFLLFIQDETNIKIEKESTKKIVSHFETPSISIKYSNLITTCRDRFCLD